MEITWPYLQRSPLNYLYYVYEISNLLRMNSDTRIKTNVREFHRILPKYIFLSRDYNIILRHHNQYNSYIVRDVVSETNVLLMVYGSTKLPYLHTTAENTQPDIEISMYYYVTTLYHENCLEPEMGQSNWSNQPQATPQRQFRVSKRHQSFSYWKRPVPEVYNFRIHPKLPQ